MKFELTQPEFLWGLPLLALVVWISRISLSDLSPKQSRLLLAVRSTIIVLLILTLAGLSLRTPSTERMVVFLVDKSRSVGTEASRFAEDFMAKVDLGPTPHETIEFAAIPRSASENKSDSNKFPIDETNIAAALKPAAALVPPDKTPHLLLFSDGNETTGNALQTALQLQNRERRYRPVKISTVPLPASSEPEVQLVEIRTPRQVRQGEPFPLELVVRANRRTEGVIRIFRDDFKLTEETKTIETGENVFRFPQEAGDERQQSYSATILSREDTILENNAATVDVYIDGPPRVLLIESDPDTVFDFISAMREQGIAIESRPPDGFPKSLDELERFEAVLFSDVPATAFSVSQLELLRNYIRDLGGGFLMLGGERSFGLGGYTETTLADPLPVRSEFEKEQEKPSLAMCLVIDRSGSMEGEKIELAKDAAKSVVELLSARDFVAVIAFDAAAHSIVSAQNVISPSTIRSRISRITAEGGTSIYPALLRTFAELENLSAKLKHVVLLTDGQSEPGDFEAIVRQMTEAKITLTTIGVGDADHDLLGRLAEIGQGRYYRCDDPRAIPQIFARETITASKSALREIPFLPVATTRSEMLAGLSFDAAPPLLGFVKTEPKPTSRTILVTETGEPLLATGRYGLGTVAAFTSDVKSRWASEWLAWPDFPVFWSQVLRYTMRKTDSKRSNVALERSGDRARLTLDVLDENEDFLDKATGGVTVFEPDGTKSNVSLDQIAPGRYETPFNIQKRGTYHFRPRLETDAGQTVETPTQSLAVGYPEELYLKEPNTTLLKRIAETTGGTYRPSPEEFAATILGPNLDAVTWKTRPLWPWLLAAAVCLFVFDVLLRRVDFVQ